MDEKWLDFLRQADDDYLAGISNKGIVKRAYKDLEQESFAAEYGEAEVLVKLKEETCGIKMPLGESSCTCPSRSICRHIMTAVLWLKQQAEETAGGAKTAEAEGASESAEVTNREGAAKAAEAEGASESAEVTNREGAEKLVEAEGAAEPAEVTNRAGVAEPAEAEEIAERVGELTEKGMETAASPRPRFAEFLEMPTERLVKACGASRFRKLLEHLRLQEIPPVEISSVVTVNLPWEPAVVKLLEPLAYLSCTCHSKELCAHKAQALLIWRVQEGVCTLAELEAESLAGKALDREQVQEACASIREAIEVQMSMGLSRQSPEISESLERLAVISHRAGLAEPERLLREAATEYKQYFERKAVFREKELSDRLLKIYCLAGRIRQEKNAEKLRELAGTFREDYEAAGRLHLIGMGSRSFQSKAGYEGEIYYFLNLTDGEFLTWTDARPTFYEGVRKIPRNSVNNSSAPWGLNCSREQLSAMEVELTNARLSSGGRLSASGETKGEILGAGNLYAKEVCERIVWDYKELLDSYFRQGKYEMGGRSERPALLGAVRWGETSFDKINQRFSWELFDGEGKCVSVSIQYTKEEKMMIRLLERLEKRMKEKNYASLVLFGTLYLEKGRMCLYPVEFWLQEEADLLAECGKTIWQTEKAGAEETEGQTAGKMREEEAAEVEKLIEKSAEGLPENVTEEVFDVMEQYLKEAERNLADLFVSGLVSCQEELTERLLACSREGEELGLHRAGEKFAGLGELLNARRHQMVFSPEPLLEIWESLEGYLKACGEKVSRDRAYYCFLRYK